MESKLLGISRDYSGMCGGAHASLSGEVNPIYTLVLARSVLARLRQALPVPNHEPT